MSHWQLLDLTPDADERSIKRAYARLLKIHRPDEDPEAFQRLREAYEASLAEASWRAQFDEDGEDTPLAVSELPQAPVQPAAVVEHFEIPLASPPEPSFAQMQQWLAEGKERQVMDALRHWLASDWLLSFERRQQFEQDVLDWLESAPRWSHVFFGSVCQAMGWEEAQGDLPCDYWRWNGLVERCEQQVTEENVRNELAKYDADKVLGQAPALLLKPLSDARRRGMADHFSAHDWQRFTQLAETIEYRDPELPRRLGLQPLDNWRDWLPAQSYRGVYLFTWLAFALLVAPSLLASPRLGNGLSSLLVIYLFIPAVMFLGVKLYRAWSYVALPLASLDVSLSRWVLPRALYRQGAGLLLLRHVIPCAVPATLAYAWSSHVPWLQAVSPVVVFVGMLYFTNDALRGGEASIWKRAGRAIKQKVERLPWHLLKRQNLLIVLAVIAMGVWVYVRTKPGV